MITDFDSSLARFLRPHAERSAEPHEDREPEQRDADPVKVEDWIRADSNRVAAQLDARQFSPDAVALHRRVEALARRDNASGDMTRGKGFVGVREDGRKNNPDVGDWNYRPMVHGPDGKLITQTQQDTPVHGREMPDHFGNPREQRRRAKRLSEAAAERENLKREGRDGAPTASVDIAAALGMSRRQLQRRRAGRRR